MSKKINLLDNTSNQLPKFRIKNWIEINDQSRGVYNTNTDTRFKTAMLKSNFANILVHTYLLKEEWQLLEMELMMQ